MESYFDHYIRADSFARSTKDEELGFDVGVECAVSRAHAYEILREAGDAALCVAEDIAEDHSVDVQTGVLSVLAGMLANPVLVRANLVLDALKYDEDPRVREAYRKAQESVRGRAF